MSTDEKTELFMALLKAGFDKDAQLEVLAANGISEPAKMTSGQARGMIENQTITLLLSLWKSPRM